MPLLIAISPYSEKRLMCWQDTFPECRPVWQNWCWQVVTAGRTTAKTVSPFAPAQIARFTADMAAAHPLMALAQLRYYTTYALTG